MISIRSIACFFKTALKAVDYLSLSAAAVFFVVLTFLSAAPIVSNAQTTTASTSCPILSANLGPGSTDATTGGQVSRLQNFLAHYVATTSAPFTTGFFGAQTESRVLQFQQAQGMATSGIVGTSTRAAVAQVCASTQPPALVPLATLDQSSLTSLSAVPMLSGSASNLTGPLRLVITSAADGKALVYQNNTVPVVGGRWSVTVFPALADGPYQVQLFGGAVPLGSGEIVVGLKAIPEISLDASLPPFDVADGHLMHFKIINNSASSVSIDQFAFSLIEDSATVSAITLYAYSDSAYSQPLASSTDGMINSTPIDPTTASFTLVPDAPVEIPAGHVYYFALEGAVVPTDTTYAVATTLLGDATATTTAPEMTVASTSNFVWSPDTYDVSSTTDADWINGSLVPGLPQSGLLEVRTNAPLDTSLACNASASVSTTTPNQPVTLTWTSQNAQYATVDSGAKAAAVGNGVFTMGSTTHTYIVTVYGTGGFATCFATVVIPGTVSTTTGQTSTTTPPADGFTATPTSGTASLVVAFAGSVNNNKICTAQTFTLGYGDGTASSTISVPANLCKAQSFSFNHTYSKVGTSTAGLYRSTGTTSAQRIQTQAIVVVAKKTSLLFDAASNIADAFSALNESVIFWIQNLARLFGIQ